MEQKDIERIGTFALGGLAILIVLIIIVGIIAIATGGISYEEMYFFEEENVPQDAVIIHLTEEEYEQFPALKNIPTPIKVDASIFSAILPASGYIDTEMRDKLWQTYTPVYVEHEGVIYKTALAVS